MKINDEAKTRQLTKVVVLGKAKVMGFNELEEARAKRPQGGGGGGGGGRQARKLKANQCVDESVRLPRKDRNERLNR